MLTTKHLPQSYTGQRFCEFFNHRFNFIKADYSSIPEWRTVSDYPIEHRNLWAAYQDPERLIGLSFGTTTRYAVLDIDRGSPYHPASSEAQYRELIGEYEGIGINAVVTVQSSGSGGLHVYLVFPKTLPTYKLAQALRLTATRAGYDVKDGKLEIFPNTKAYSKHGKTAYKPVRLPLQQGSYLLDKDFIPYSNEIGVFLEQAEAAAKEQDLNLLEVALEAASQIKQFRRVKGSGDASSFAQDLREQIAEGWTGLGQTNDLLRIIGTYGRVFKGLEGQALVDYIETKAESSPGYKQYCQHKHHIKQRAKDWARCIEKYYYPYGSEPVRCGSFKDLQKCGNRAEKTPKPPKENVVNKNRQSEAIERIKEGIVHVKSSVQALPRKVGELKTLLLGAIFKLSGVRTSDKTLNRYRQYWHPKYLVSVEAEVSEEAQGEAVEKEEQAHSPTSTVKSSPPPTLKMPLNDSVNGGKEEEEEKAPELGEKRLESAQAEETSLCHTPSPVPIPSPPARNPVNPSPDKSSSIYAIPLSYKKVYELTRSANGLLSKRLSSSRQTRLRLHCIEEGVLVRLCRGAKHSMHPQLVYVKPVEGADDWIGGIAVSPMSLVLPDDS